MSTVAVPLLKVTEVAERLNLSRSAVYGLMDSGALAYVKIGKSRRVRTEEVVRLIEAGTVSQK